MKRKRLVKLLMAHGISRNVAVKRAEKKRVSNEYEYKLFMIGERMGRSVKFISAAFAIAMLPSYNVEKEIQREIARIEAALFDEPKEGEV